MASVANAVAQGEAAPASQCVLCMLVEQLNPGDSGSSDLQDQAAVNNPHVYAGALGALEKKQEIL